MKEELLVITHAKNCEVDELKTEMKVMRTEYDKLKMFINDGEAYECRDAIVLSGDKIPNGTNEDIFKNISRQLIKNQLTIELTAEEIITVYTDIHGRKPVTQDSDKRNIILKLCLRDMKREVFIAIVAFQLDGKVNKLQCRYTFQEKDTIVIPIRESRRF